MEMSKVVADLEYVLADSYALGDDADVNTDDNVEVPSSALTKVSLCDWMDFSLWKLLIIVISFMLH